MTKVVRIVGGILAISVSGFFLFLSFLSIPSAFFVYGVNWEYIVNGF